MSEPTDVKKDEVAQAAAPAEAAPSTSAAPALSKEEAEKETLRQIEFYFSDVNLPFDKFLWTLTRKEDGWVPIATVSSFKRMKPMREALSEEEIVKVLQGSDLLEVDAEAKKIRRKTPISQQKDAYERSIYAVSARWRACGTRDYATRERIH